MISFDKVNYIISNPDTIPLKTVVFYNTPYYLLKESIYGSQHVKWVKISSDASGENSTMETVPAPLSHWPRWIRIMFCIVTFIPGLLIGPILNSTIYRNAYRFNETYAVLHNMISQKNAKSQCKG